MFQFSIAGVRDGVLLNFNGINFTDAEISSQIRNNKFQIKIINRIKHYLLIIKILNEPFKNKEMKIYKITIKIIY